MLKKILTLAFAALLPTLGMSDPGTAFTYQGFLQDGGVPINGDTSLRFTLFDAAVDGSQVGAPLEKLSVQASNGLVNTVLDFGMVFDGTPFWLEVQVDADGGGDSYVTLDQRTHLLPVPYAVYAETSGSDLEDVLASGNDGAAQDVRNLGDVEVGTAITPKDLSVRGTVEFGENLQHKPVSMAVPNTMVAGYVDGISLFLGTEVSGPGYTAAVGSSSPGVEITFDPPFAEPPVLTVTPIADSPNSIIAVSLLSTTPSKANILFSSSFGGGSPVIISLFSSFTFIAVGRRSE